MGKALLCGETDASEQRVASAIRRFRTAERSDYKRLTDENQEASRAIG
ncbi:MAG: hypothetical protein HKP58_02625 [Desulfatitalea sp.]|nr:hypothetical protein [Desulfatitalea sp.]NNJ99285.1 hypothetical protein [Desulfatitalea sp.]